MVTTDRPDFAETLRRFRNHGISSEARERQSAGQWYYEMVMLGMNYRLPDINCALGLSQMKRLTRTWRDGGRLAAMYGARLAGLPGLILPMARADVNPAWHLYAVRVDASKLTVGRAEVFRALRAENIGVNVHYIPVHLHPYYRERFGYKGGEFPVAEAAYEAVAEPADVSGDDGCGHRRCGEGDGESFGALCRVSHAKVRRSSPKFPAVSEI